MTELVNTADSQAMKSIVVTVSKSSVKKKPARQMTILKSENSYLQKRAKNIQRILLKMNELDAEAMQDKKMTMMIHC